MMAGSGDTLSVLVRHILRGVPRMPVTAALILRSVYSAPGDTSRTSLTSGISLVARPPLISRISLVSRISLHIALKAVQRVRRSSRRGSGHIPHRFLYGVAQSGKITSVDSIVYRISDPAADSVDFFIIHIILCSAHSEKPLQLPYTGRLRLSGGSPDALRKCFTISKRNMQNYYTATFDKKTLLRKNTAVNKMLHERFAKDYN